MESASIESLAALANYCEHFARRMLAATGAFHPFGAFINAQGRVEALAAGGKEATTTHEIYAFLHQALAQMAREGRIRACAIATDVDIPARYAPPLPDGIRVQVEAPGYARHVYTPYRRLAWPGLRRFLVVLPTVEYAAPIPVDVAPDVFRDA